MTPSATIFALATAPGRGGVAVFRISGPDAARAFTLCRPETMPEARRAELRRLENPASGETIDHALVLWFPAPHSFTGENVLELHTHGGRAMVRAVTEALARLPNFRAAEPGEFSRRAFENGKLDLTEAEAIADLVNAETEAQRRQALRQFEGALGRLYEGWRARMIRVLAYEEAAIDFSEEELPPDMGEKQTRAIAALADEIADHLHDHRRGERIREGFEIAILGAPNAGKSSLLNALAGRDAAIVSSTAGTTRDVVEVHLDLSGYPVTLADTAGLREASDVIEGEGIRRARARAEQADLKLLVFDGALWPETDAATRALMDDDSIIVVNKCDLGSVQGSGKREKGGTFFPSSLSLASLGSRNPEPRTLSPLFVSALHATGLDTLLERLTAEIDRRFTQSAAPPLTRARHRAALEDCENHLRRALVAREAALRAEDVRLAGRALGRITGRVDVEDLLDIIFRDFCIGK